MRFMFLGMMGAYLLGNAYIFIRGWQGINALLPLFHCSRGGAVGIKILFTILVWGAAASLFIALFSRDATLPAWLQGGMYNLGSIWLVFTLYMVLALLAVDLMKGILVLGNFSRLHNFHQWLRHFGTIGAFFFTTLLLLYGYINYMNPKVEEIDIALGCGEISRQEENLSGRKQVRIVAISDVHLGYATQKKHLQRYVKQINSLSPDIILIAGDLIDNSVKPLWEQKMQEELGMLKAPGGIYMVPGNHEYISGIADAEAFLQETPVVLLRDSVVVLPCGVALAGRDDRSNRKRLPVEELLEKAGNAPVILLDHQPYDIALKDSLGVDLQFNGHTHRGQVWPMSIMVDRMYEQSHGYHKWPNSHVIVSSGLSLWGPPFRIGTNSDLWIINLRL